MYCEIIQEMFKSRNYKDIRVEENKIIGMRDNDKIVAFTEIIPKLTIGYVKNIVKEMQETDIKQALIIYRDSQTTISTILSAVLQLGLSIEVFCITELQYNITKHELVPKHILLSKEEAKKMREFQIPFILRSDPIVRFYDFKRGDVIRIERKTLPAYRLVK